MLCRRLRPMRLASRRTFLKSGTLAAGYVTVGRRVHAMALPVDTGKTLLSQFDYADVQLLDGPMLDQFRENHRFFLTLSEDSMLKPFRQAAGQPAPGEDMGGWYSASPDFNPPKNLTGYIPGHSFGQYLSALSRAYAITGDKPTQAKVHRLTQG